MSSTKERLVKAWKNSLLAGMATVAKSPTQLDEAIKELNKSLKKLGIELTDEERKEARDTALQKRDKPEEFLASLAKALEKARGNDRGDKMGFKKMMEKGEMILPENISEKQKKLLLEVFTDVAIYTEEQKPLQVVAPRYEGTFDIDDATLDMIDSTVEIYPSEGDKIKSVHTDNFSSPGEGARYEQKPNSCVVIQKAGKEEEGLNFLTVHFNPRQTEVEKPIEQKVQERKKGAVEKRIFEKAATTAQELGREKVSPPGPFGYNCVYVKFRNRNLKIVLDSSPANCVRIYAKRERKILKRLVFIGHRCSGPEVYKPGKWEKLLDTLYEQALAHKRKKEETKREMREQELVEDFNL